MIFDLDRTEFLRLTTDPHGLVGDYLRERARKLQALAIAQAGLKTGDLRRSIKFTVARSGSGLVATVGSDNRIAFMHHVGTKPHVILPRRAKTLRFYSRGKIVYAKIVHHPGTKANRYLTDNLSAAIR